MRQRAAQIRDAFVSGGFLALAEQYEALAQDGARWVRAAMPLYANEPIEAFLEEAQPGTSASKAGS